MESLTIAECHWVSGADSEFVTREFSTPIYHNSHQILTETGVAVFAGIGLVGGGYAGYRLTNKPVGILPGIMIGAFLPVAIHFVANQMIRIYEVSGILQNP